MEEKSLQRKKKKSQEVFLICVNKCKTLYYIRLNNNKETKEFR